MTQKNSTPKETTETTANSAESSTSMDALEMEKKGWGGFIWFLLAAILIGLGIFAIDKGYLDRLLNTAEDAPMTRQTKTFQPKPARSDSEDNTAASRNSAPDEELSVLVSNQRKSEQERQQIKRRVNALQQQMDEVNNNIKELAQAVASLKENSSSRANAQAISGAEVAALEAQISALTVQIANLQDNQAQSHHQYSGRLQLLQLLDSIANKAETGESFTKEAAELESLTAQLNMEGDAQQILAEHAAEGVRPLSKLINDFGEATKLALPYSLNTKETKSLGDKLRGSLAHIVTIRKTDVESEDNSDEAHIARAEAELRAGNVQMALTHLEQLSLETRKFFFAWSEQAHGYLDTQRALEQLKSAITPPAAG